MRPLLVVSVVAAALVCQAPSVAADVGDGDAICLMIESAAKTNGLPIGFFARVIWQESRFDSSAVGPVTRSGAQAQGIAQFMPATAAERNLLDPFDPVQALPKAAEFLRDLRAEFGNLGLAAAAYNAGPRRVHEWLNGTGSLPTQTRAYVAAITGRTADDWRGALDVANPAKPASCATLMAMLRRTPSRFLMALQRHVQQGVARPWGIQLAASFSRERALAAYSRAIKRVGTTLHGHDDPLILRRTIRSRGTRPLFQIRLGADTRAAADRLCGLLRAHGGACIVLRNG